MTEPARTTPDSVAGNFWPLLRQADRDDGRLRELLAELSRAELIRFYRDYVQLAGELREPPYAAAESSQDAAEDIAWWVVAQGEQTYRRIYDHPEQTPTQLPRDRAGLGFISQLGDVFFERFGEELTSVDLGQV